MYCVNRSEQSVQAYPWPCLSPNRISGHDKQSAVATQWQKDLQNHFSCSFGEELPWSITSTGNATAINRKCEQVEISRSRLMGSIQELQCRLLVRCRSRIFLVANLWLVETRPGGRNRPDSHSDIYGEKWRIYAISIMILGTLILHARTILVTWFSHKELFIFSDFSVRFYYLTC